MTVKERQGCESLALCRHITQASKHASIHALNRAEFQSALDDVVANQRGIDFQRIAIPLARERCPQIVANEVTKDGGADGFLATVSLDDKHVLAVGCSITATWAKVRHDLRTLKERNRELSAFWFYTARVVTAELADKWCESAKQEFQVSLTVFSREEIVQRLLEPQNHYLARLHLGIAASDTGALEDTRIQLAESAQKRIAAWLRHHMDRRLAPVPREYWIGEEQSGGRRTVRVEDLAKGLLAGGVFLVSGEGGLGKTVALGQIASELLRRASAPTPLLASAPSWARSGQPLAPFLAGHFLEGGNANSAALQALMIRGQVAVFLNGWNEVPMEQTQRLVEGLTDSKLAAPGCAIVLATRGSTSGSLGPISRYDLAPLSPTARRLLVEQLGPSKVDEVFDVIALDAEVEALSRLPLFLVPLVDTIVRGDAPPRHRHALLEAAVCSIERVPDHERVLNAPTIRSRYRPALARLALEMSLRGTTEATREDAASWLTDITGSEHSAEQLLEMVTQHHVLVSESGQAIRFQHQYFQDWFCAQYLRRLAGSAGGDWRSALAPLVDDRRLTEAWGLVMAALADESSATHIAIGLFRIALDVDLTLAADWTPILGSHLSRASIDELKSRLRSWIALGGGAVELGLRSVLAARFEDFAEEFWRRLESDDRQVRLGTYRLLEPFPVEVLGPDWRARVGGWPPERRMELAMEAAEATSHDSLGLAKDFATRDPSPMVRGRCLGHIAFYDRAAAARLFTGATEESVAEVLEYGTLDLLPRDEVNRHLAYIERVARTEPLNPLASRALSYLRDVDPLRVVDIYKRNLPEEREDIHRQRSILEFIAQYDRQWVAHWVLRKLVGLNYVREELQTFLTEIDNNELEQSLNEVLENSDPPPHRLAAVLAAFLRLGRPALVHRCLDELGKLNATQTGSWEKLTEPQRDRLLELERALRNTPLSTLVPVLAARQETLIDPRATRRAIDFLAFSAAETSDGVLAADSSQGRELETLVRRLGAIVLSAEDPDGHDKAALARLIGNIGAGGLRDLLQQLIGAESTRVRQFFNSARGEGQRRSGGYMSHEQWYVKAVSQAGGPGRIADLLALFEDEVFELDSGQELTRLAGLPIVGGRDSLGTRADWAAIGAEHRRVGERVLSSEARKVASAVERHRKAWSERPAPPVTHGSRESRIASLEILHARLTGSVRAEPLLPLAANHHSVYPVERWLQLLVRCGITVPSAVANTALATWLERTKTVWHRPEDIVSLIRGYLTVLMFSDDLKLAGERFRELMPRLKPEWEMRDIWIPLAASSLADRVELLLEALPSSGNETDWYEWIHALRLLPTEKQRQVARALLTDAKWTEGWTQSATRDRSLIEAIVFIVQQDEPLRQTLKSSATIESTAPLRDLCRHLLIAMGDPDSAMTALQAALADPTLRGLAQAAIGHARWHAHPDQRSFPDHSAPQALTAVRKLLLQTVYGGDESSRAWARQVLVEMDSQLDGSYPIAEPRHPDLASGFAWPIVLNT